MQGHPRLGSSCPLPNRPYSHACQLLKLHCGFTSRCLGSKLGRVPWSESFNVKKWDCSSGYSGRKIGFLCFWGSDWRMIKHPVVAFAVAVYSWKHLDSETYRLFGRWCALKSPSVSDDVQLGNRENSTRTAMLGSDPGSRDLVHSEVERRPALHVLSYFIWFQL